MVFSQIFHLRPADWLKSSTRIDCIDCSLVFKISDWKREVLEIMSPELDQLKQPPQTGQALKHLVVEPEKERKEHYPIASQIKQSKMYFSIYRAIYWKYNLGQHFDFKPFRKLQLFPLNVVHWSVTECPPAYLYNGQFLSKSLYGSEV